MSHITYGIGIDDNNLGSLVAYGLGVNPLGLIINESVTFSSNFGIETFNTLTAERLMSFDTELDASILNQLSASENISFTTDLDYSILNQLDGNSNIDFNLNLDLTVLKSLITDIGITFDADLDLESATFLLKEIFNRHNIYLISEEIRLAIVHKEDREFVAEEEIRTIGVKQENRETEVAGEEERVCPVMFENRVVIVPQKGD